MVEPKGETGNPWYFEEMLTNLYWITRENSQTLGLRVFRPSIYIQPAESTWLPYGDLEDINQILKHKGKCEVIVRDATLMGDNQGWTTKLQDRGFYF